MKIAKDCPFCGEDIGPVVARQGTKYTFYQVMHQPNKKGRRHGLIIMDVDEWNTRPIEDALNARIAELELRLDVYNGNMYDVVVDENAKANKRIAELEAERRWIPVSERLPEENQQILSTDGKEFYLDYYARWEGKDNPPCFCDGLSWAVTHWMPLPEPPEVK